MVRHGSKFKLTAARIEQLEGFFARHGGKTILIGRFIGLLRVFAPFVAGASRMPGRRFFPYALLAAGAWSAAFSLLGFAFWQSFDEAVNLAKQGTLALTAVIALIAGALVLFRYLRTSGNRARDRDEAPTTIAGERPGRQSEPLPDPAANQRTPAPSTGLRP
jgi:membrane protein DedA with SNARE-associated domain